jgi:hypothetical protein
MPVKDSRFLSFICNNPSGCFYDNHSPGCCAFSTDEMPTLVGIAGNLRGQLQ